MSRSSRWLVAVTAMAAGLLAFGSSAPAPAAEGARVLMVDNQPDLTNWHFAPKEVTVPVGATVVWFNKGKQDHTVTADDRSFDSGMKGPGASWQHAFPRAGRYSYYCAPHPWMKGTVRVVGAATAAAQPPATATSATTATPPTAAPRSAAASGAPSTATTFPPSLAAQRSEAPAPAPAPAPDTAETTATPPSPPPPLDESDRETTALAAGSRRDSGGNVLGTTAIVVLPTLAALAIGARLRRRSEPAGA